MRVACLQPTGLVLFCLFFKNVYSLQTLATRPRLESSSSVNSDSLAQEFSQLASDLHDGMEVGSLVEVCLGGRLLYGVVRWFGKPRSKSEQGLVGVELVRCRRILLDAKH